MTSRLASPYHDHGINTIYNLLFGDNLELYKASVVQPYTYPFDVLFSETSSLEDYQKVIGDRNLESRTKILAHGLLRAKGNKTTVKELLGVVVEVGLEEGLDVLASYRDGTARYINQTGKMIFWESPNAESERLTNDLFVKCEETLENIGPWENERRPPPSRGAARISFLASDGLYFGEGPIDVLFNDPKGRAPLLSATQLMMYLTENALGNPD